MSVFYAEFREHNAAMYSGMFSTYDKAIDFLCRVGKSFNTSLDTISPKNSLFPTTNFVYFDNENYGAFISEYVVDEDC